MKIKKYSENEKMYDVILTIIFVLTIFGILFAKAGIYYPMNDDLLMMNILSGRYTGMPSIHAIYTVFPSSLIINMLYRICNIFDWYFIMLILCRLTFYIIAMYKIISKFKNVLTKIIVLLASFVLYFILENRLVTGITFTEISIFIMTCVLILFILYNENKKHEKILIIIGIVLSFSIRKNGCLMLLLFMLPIGIYKCLGNVEKFKKYLLLAVEIIVILGIILISNVVIDKLAGWNEYKEYDKYRSQYYDYYKGKINNLSQEEKEELYSKSDITELDIIRIQNYYLRFR